PSLHFGKVSERECDAVLVSHFLVPRNRVRERACRIRQIPASQRNIAQVTGGGCNALEIANLTKHLDRLPEHRLRAVQIALLKVEGGEIARCTSCIVAIANGCVTLSSTVAGLGGGIAIADLAENSVGSRNKQSRTLHGPLFDGAPRGSLRLDDIVIDPRARLDIVDAWIVARRKRKMPKTFERVQRIFGIHPSLFVGEGKTVVQIVRELGKQLPIGINCSRPILDRGIVLTVNQQT